MIEIVRQNYFSRQIEYNQNVIFLKPSARRAAYPIFYHAFPWDATFGIVSNVVSFKISHIEETTIEKDGSINLYVSFFCCSLYKII